MRPFIFIITVFLFASCEKDRYLCPEEEVRIIECELNLATKGTSKPYDIDTAYIKDDSVFYYLNTPIEYDCAHLMFCNNNIYIPDSFPPYAFLEHILLYRSESPERVIKLFSYDLTFLDEYFVGDSIGIWFSGKDNLSWIDYYKR